MEPDHKCGIQVPDDAEVIDTPIGYFWFEKSILYSVGKKKTRDMEMVKESMAILRNKVGDKKVCLISDTTNTTYYNIEMREELAHSLSDIVKAIAIVPCSPSGKLMGSILFMRNTGFPAKLFDDLEEAKKWIKQFF